MSNIRLDLQLYTSFRRVCLCIQHVLGKLTKVHLELHFLVTALPRAFCCCSLISPEFSVMYQLMSFLPYQYRATVHLGSNHLNPWFLADGPNGAPRQNQAFDTQHRSLRPLERQLVGTPIMTRYFAWKFNLWCFENTPYLSGLFNSFWRLKVGLEWVLFLDKHFKIDQKVQNRSLSVLFYIQVKNKSFLGWIQSCTRTR